MYNLLEKVRAMPVASFSPASPLSLLKKQVNKDEGDKSETQQPSPSSMSFTAKERELHALAQTEILRQLHDELDAVVVAPRIAGPQAAPPEATPMDDHWRVDGYPCASVFIRGGLVFVFFEAVLCIRPRELNQALPGTPAPPKSTKVMKAPPGASGCASE
jgi:hypothetical protein